MREPFQGINKKLNFFSAANKNYKQLRKHLDQQPVGFPATPTGVEIRLLKEIFTAEEAGAALCLTYKFELFHAIYDRAKENGYTEEKFKSLLTSMEEKGCIFVKHEKGQIYYALHPFAIGMFEMQISRLTPGFFLDSHNYMLQRFAVEYLTTEVPQMRVIPIQKSVTPDQHIATYDQIRDIVDRTKDRITLASCICKTGRDLIGDPCRATDRRDVCIGFRDFSDTYARHGWGRIMTKEEAMEILDQNEKDGLVLIASSMQEPQYVCSCCDCCCGILEMIRLVPRPVDFAASNFYTEVDIASCIGCGKCVKRCQMDAIQFDEEAKKATAINRKRCIGCGLCVPSCKSESIKLKKKDGEFIPPKDHDALYEMIMQNKRRLGGKMAKMTRAFMGMKL